MIKKHTAAAAGASFFSAAGAAPPPPPPPQLAIFLVPSAMSSLMSFPSNWAKSSFNFESSHSPPTAVMIFLTSFSVGDSLETWANRYAAMYLIFNWGGFCVNENNKSTEIQQVRLTHLFWSTYNMSMSVDKEKEKLISLYTIP